MVTATISVSPGDSAPTAPTARSRAPISPYSATAASAASPASSIRYHQAREDRQGGCPGEYYRRYHPNMKAVLKIDPQAVNLRSAIPSRTATAACQTG